MVLGMCAMKRMQVGCMEAEWERGMGIARTEIAYLWSAWEKMVPETRLGCRATINQ
jgi:hypothetical protein